MSVGQGGTIVTITFPGKQMITETILVIDDDQDLRETIVEILEDNGFRSLPAQQRKLHCSK